MSLKQQLLDGSKGSFLCEKLTGTHILPFALSLLCGVAIWDYEETI